ncbi:MAG TPA: amidohydrolase family protein [Planctomycetaceae bacterium]|nr:amidohydrolase family protein [Planctomycetaceae bacterium]
MTTLDRRSFLKRSLVPAVLASLPVSVAAQARGRRTPPLSGPEIVDTNVHLFDWPFRRLKYSSTPALVAKLRKHRIRQAWAGSFEAVLHKQLDAVNRRLAEECRTSGEGLLIPFGSVNPVWPDWDEDLRRCHEAYRMPGLRLYPAYHGYTLDRPEFARLLSLAVERGLVVQIAIRMEDERVHHPALDAPLVDASPLPDVLKKVPRARVQLINCDTALRGGHVPALIGETSATFDIAGVEANGGVGRLIEGTHPYYRMAVPVERLLFGSHAPFFPCESALLKLFESPLSREQLEPLMHANAGRLLEGV